MALSSSGTRNVTTASAASQKEENSWWGSWLETAKEKSAAALQQVTQDLQEFTSTIQKDTSHAVASSATVLGNSIKKEDNEEDEENKEPTASEAIREGFYNFLSNISHSLRPSDDPGEALVVEYDSIHHKGSTMFDQAQARLHAIQTDPATYCNEPDGHPEFFEEWMETFKVEEHKGEISELLVAKTQVRSLYTKLVPAAVSHTEFWSRYFYKIHQLNQDEARRKSLKERAEMTSSQNLEEELGWGDEDESWDTMPDVNSGVVSIDSASDISANNEITGKNEDTERTEKPEGISESDPNLPSDLEKLRIQDNTDKKDNEPQTSSTKIADNDRLEGDSLTGDRGMEKEELTAKEDVETHKEGHEMVVRSSTQSSDGSSGNKESSSLGDEWEKDFDDIEITEEDIKNAALLKGSVAVDDDLDDWENWD